MTLTKVSLNDGRLSKHPQQGRLQLPGGRKGVKNALEIGPSGLEPDYKLPDDSVEATLEVKEKGDSANPTSLGGGKEASHTKGGKSSALAAEASTLRIKEDRT